MLRKPKAADSIWIRGVSIVLDSLSLKRVTQTKTTDLCVSENGTGHRKRDRCVCCRDLPRASSSIPNTLFCVPH